MTAVLLTTALPGSPPRRRAVLGTGTPGLFLTRRREPCPHHPGDPDGEYTPGVCPGREPWEWQVLSASALTIGRPWRPGDGPCGVAEARALAADLGRTGVDWTVPDAGALLDQLTGPRLDAVAAAARRHGVPGATDPAAGIARARARYATLTGSR